jgi:hypothetical protein
MFPGIGALPKPATETHVVNRGTPVAPFRLRPREKESPAAAFPAAMMLVSTRKASAAKRFRRLLLLSIFFVTTAAFAIPPACASEDVKAVCLSLVKAKSDIDRDRVIRTSCVLVEADEVVAEIVGGESVVQSVVSSLPDGDIRPSRHGFTVFCF